ncbi:hypothetical protein ANO11243_086730 [Dothideomycetidae sp. 11243]|nr:hypothetical protein ANO11243_086730 [fungal sp. No.11243]
MPSNHLKLSFVDEASFLRLQLMCETSSPFMFGLSVFSYLMQLEPWLEIRTRVAPLDQHRNDDLDEATLTQFLRCIAEPTVLSEAEWELLWQCCRLRRLLQKQQELSSIERFFLCFCLQEYIAKGGKVMWFWHLVRNTEWSYQITKQKPDWFDDCLQKYNGKSFREVLGLS